MDHLTFHVSRFTFHFVFLLLIVTMFFLVGNAAEGQTDGHGPRHHLDESHRERIQAALDKASDWLVLHQGNDSAFRSEKVDSVPPLPLTAMALWALSEADETATHSQVCQSAVDYLLSFQQPDGGIYEPSAGLVRYTSAVARQGLQAWRNRQRNIVPYDNNTLHNAIDRLNLFVYRHQDLESLVDEENRPAPGQITADIEQLLQHDDLPENIQNALEFLLKANRKPTDQKPHHLVNQIPEESDQTSPTVTYDELLRYIGEISRTDNPTVWRTYQALHTGYTLEGNPDLTKRYGPDGFQDKAAGLYYYYLTLARTLGTVGRPTFKTDDGVEHDWASEIGDCLLNLQKSEGFWVNKNERWFEGDSVLVTCYAMLSLSICRDVKGPMP